MNGNELRKGNLVYFNNFLCEIVEIKSTVARIKFVNGENKNHIQVEYEMIESITLTDERLIEFGFEKIGSEWNNYDSMNEDVIVLDTSKNGELYYSAGEGVQLSI